MTIVPKTEVGNVDAATGCEEVPFAVPKSYREMLRQEIAAAYDAVTANELLGQHPLADWWRWRAQDLELLLEELRNAPLPDYATEADRAA